MEGGLDSSKLTAARALPPRIKRLPGPFVDVEDFYTHVHVPGPREANEMEDYKQELPPPLSPDVALGVEG